MGIGSLLFSLPHFLSEPLEGNDTSDIITTTCSVNNGTENPTIQQTSMAKSDYFLVFVFGQILHGIGAAPILSLGIFDFFYIISSGKQFAYYNDNSYFKFSI